MTPNQLSEQLLLQVKMQKPTNEIVSALEKLSLQNLKNALHDDDHKKAFWINLYNAFFLILRKELKLDKPAIYRDRVIIIAGQTFSLDDIEHGILRKYRFKWALGYLPHPFAPAIVKRLAVSKMDYRIHFALNCGAKSCPPIAFYSTDQLERQLNMAALAFLEYETEVFTEKKEVHVTRLFQWFLGDFGGKRGIRRILKKHLQLETKGMKIVYREYDWTEDLDAFVDR